MCDPVTLAVTAVGVSAATTGLSFLGQQQAAKSNAQAANVTAANSYNDIGRRGVQIDQQNSENILSSLIDRTAAQGAISASASAMGTGVATTDQISNAAAFGAGRNASIDQLNSDNQRGQLTSDRTGVSLRRQSQINSVQGPSLIGLGFQLAGDTLKGASTYTSLGGKFGSGASTSTWNPNDGA